MAYTFVPPYFAVHPPVYYSLPKPRPYGESPFAWYGGPYYRPPRGPMLVRNPMALPPLVSPERKTPAPEEKTASVPPVIYNPFVNHTPDERQFAQTSKTP